MQILFVCTGNVCRSPMAEVIFSNLLKKYGQKGIRVAGAGTMTIEGLPMTPTAKKALKHRGWKIGKGIHSRQFRPEMLMQYDHIVTMTEGHKNIIGDAPNVRTLSSWVGGGDIADPFMGSLEVYLATCVELEGKLELLLKKLREAKREKT